jgi:hypothetical protein
LLPGRARYHDHLVLVLIHLMPLSKAAWPSAFLLQLHIHDMDPTNQKGRLPFVRFDSIQPPAAGASVAGRYGLRCPTLAINGRVSPWDKKE